MYDHSMYDPTNTEASWTYCPACLRIVRCGQLAYVGRFAFYRHWLDPSAPVGERDRCLNSGWPVDIAFFIRDDGRVVSREQYEVGWAPGDPVAS